HNQKLRQPGEPLSSSFTFENIYEPQPVIFIIKSLSTSNQASASNISIEVNNSQKMEIPIEMNPGEILKLDHYGNLRLYDKTWNLISEVEFKGKIPMLEKGNNLVIID